MTDTTLAGLAAAGTLGRSLRETFGETLSELASARPDVLVLDGDLANSTRADIVADRVPGQFLEMGIAEQNLIGVAAGLATMGFVPYISTFACFAVARALDQIRVTVAQPHLGVKIAAGYSGLLTGSTGKTHQLFEDLAIVRAMPFMTVLAPADDVEGAAFLRAAADIAGPVYIRLARDPERRVFEAPYGRPLGPPIVLRDGGDVLLVSTGTQAARTLTAAELLADTGIAAAVVHVPVLKPLDTAAIRALVADRRLVISVEEHSVVGGLGSALAEVIAEHGGGRLHRIGIDDRFGESGPNDALLELFGLSPERVADRVRTIVATAS
jgi:transketolase